MEAFPPSYGGRRVEFVGDYTSATAHHMCVARSQPRPFRTRKAAQTKSLFGSMKAWLRDPEVNRKKRVAKYKMYSVEGKVKKSLKNGFRWVKRKCHQFVHGY